jgi:C1A family cysteine protease
MGQENQASGGLTDVEAQIESLQKKLTEYKRLEEDLAAEKIFEAAKKKITTWLTFGGLVLTLVGVFGVREAEKYGEGLVDEQMKKLSAERIEKLVEQKSQDLVASEIKKQQPTWNADARRLIQLAVAPIGSTSPRNETLLAPTSGAVDYTELMMPVRSEGTKYSPEGSAVAYALEYQVATHLHKRVRLSFEYIYCEAQMLGGAKECMGEMGAVLSDEVRAVQTVGAVSEQAMPFGTPSPLRPIRVPPLKTAERFKAKMVRSLSTIEDMKSALRQYGPVVAGLTLYDVPRDGRGVFQMPRSGDAQMGSLSVCIVGFNDLTKMFKIELAWGTDWADHGYGYVPYDYMEKYSSDIWAISM